MKNFSKLIGLVGFIFFFFGVFFKLMHWPGAAVLILIGAVVGTIYFIMAMFCKDNFKGSTLEKINAYAASISLAICLPSFLFKIMHWQGANILLGISIIVFFIFTIILILNVFAKKEDKFFPQELFSFVIMYVVVILIFFGLPSFL